MRVSWFPQLLLDRASSDFDSSNESSESPDEIEVPSVSRGSRPPDSRSEVRTRLQVGPAQVAGGRGAARQPHSEPALLGPDRTLAAARTIAFLPVVHGGLGLRPSALLSPAAHWAAWADVVPIIAERAPASGSRVLQELESDASPIRSVQQAVAAEAVVTGPGFRVKPTWRELVAGVRPPERDQEYGDEPGQWPHGWQFHAALGLITHHREHVVLPSLDEGTQARLRSQSGAHAGDHITAHSSGRRL